MLNQMLISDSELEQSRAFTCLWTLSFIDQIRQQILDTKDCMERLEQVLERVKDPGQKQEKQRAIDYIRMGKMGLSEIATTFRGEMESSFRTKKPESSHSRHVFISYCWSHQETVLKIRERLVAMGHQVWLDVDRMHGSTLEAMAKAVEDACVVLICYSENYKLSNNCRAEAEYVFSLRKPFVPLNMQSTYKPTGWLGIILGTRLYVDFSLDLTPFDTAYHSLLRQMDQVVAPIDQVDSPNDTTDSAIGADSSSSISQRRFTTVSSVDTSSNISSVSAVSSVLLEALVKSQRRPAIKEEVKKWDKSKCLQWLKDEQIDNISSKNKLLAEIDGKVLFGLAQMKISVSFEFLKTK